MSRSSLCLHCLRQGMALSRCSVEAEFKNYFQQKVAFLKNQKDFLWLCRKHRVWVRDDFSGNATGRTGSQLFMRLRRRVPRAPRYILRISGQNVSDFVP